MTDQPVKRLSLTEVTRDELIAARERRAKENNLAAVQRLDRAIAKKQLSLSQQGTLQELKRNFFRGFAGGVGSLPKGAAVVADVVNAPETETALDKFGDYISKPSVLTETDPKSTDIGTMTEGFGQAARVGANLMSSGVGSTFGLLAGAAPFAAGAAFGVPGAGVALPVVAGGSLLLSGMGQAREAQQEAGIEDPHAGASVAAGGVIALLERLGITGAVLDQVKKSVLKQGAKELTKSGAKATAEATAKAAAKKAAAEKITTTLSRPMYGATQLGKEGGTEMGQDLVALVQANLVQGKPWYEGLDDPKVQKQLATSGIAGGLTGFGLGATFAYPGKAGVEPTAPPPGDPTSPATPPAPTRPAPTPTATVGQKPGPMVEVRTTHIPPAKVKEIVQNVAGDLAVFKKGRWFVPKTAKGALQDTFNSYLESIGARMTADQRTALDAKIAAERANEDESSLVAAQAANPIETLQAETEAKLTEENTAIGTYGEDPGLPNLSVQPTPSPRGLPLMDPSIGQAGEYVMDLAPPDQTLPYYGPKDLQAQQLTHAVMYGGNVYTGKTHFDILQAMQDGVMKDPDGTPWGGAKVDAELDKSIPGFTTPSGEFLTLDTVQNKFGTSTTEGVATAVLQEKVDLRSEQTPYVPANSAETQLLRDMYKRGKVERVMNPKTRKYGYFPVAEEERTLQAEEAKFEARVRPIPVQEPTVEAQEAPVAPVEETPAPAPESIRARRRRVKAEREETERVNPAQNNLDAIYNAYKSIVANSSRLKDGDVVPLKDIYAVLKYQLAAPTAEGQLTLVDFAADINAIDQQPNLRTNDGRGFSLPASTSSKNARVVIPFTDKAGQKRVYAGIRFGTPVKGKPAYTSPLPNVFAVESVGGKMTLVVPVLDPAAYKGLLDSVRAYINRVAPGVKLVAAKISDARMGALTDPVNQIIYYSLEHGQGIYHASHEVIHALKDLFTPQEWAILVEKSRRKWVDQFGVAKMGYAKEDRIEEGIAYAHSDFKTHGGKYEPAVRRAFSKLSDLFTKVWNFLRRRGFNSPESIFRKIESGEIGARGVRRQTEGTAKAGLSSPEFRSRAREVVEELAKGPTMPSKQLAKKFASLGVPEKELVDRGFEKFAAENPNPSWETVQDWLDRTEVGLETTTFTTPELDRSTIDNLFTITEITLADFVKTYETVGRDTAHWWEDHKANEPILRYDPIDKEKYGPFVYLIIPRKDNGFSLVRENTRADLRSTYFPRYTPLGMTNTFRDAELGLINDVNEQNPIQEELEWAALYPDPDYRTPPTGHNYREVVIGAKGEFDAGRTHWLEVNAPVVHIRMTDDTLSSGDPVVMVHEVQSDWANGVRKYGEKVPQDNYDQFERDSWQAKREANDLTESILSPEEASSYVELLANKLRTIKQTISEEDATSALGSVFGHNRSQSFMALTPEQAETLLVDVPNKVAQYKHASLQLRKGVSPIPVPPVRLAIRAAIRDAVQRGIGRIAWTPSDLQVKLWGERSKRGLQNVYDTMIPNELKRFQKRYGGELGKDTITDPTTGKSYTVNTFTIPKGFAREVTGGVYKWALAENPHPSPSVSWTTKLIDRFNQLRNRFFSVYGSLPDIAQLRAIRYLALGEQTKAGEFVHEAASVLKDATEHDKAAIMDYFETQDATLPTLDNPTLGTHITKFKEIIHGISAKLFELGLITEDQYNTYEDKYLPYVYYWHLLDDKERRSLGSGAKASPLDWQKGRDPSLDELTRMVMGQVKDPMFLISKVFGTQLRDIAIIESLNKIAENPNWVWQPSLVEYNGAPVTTFWLAKTADKIDQMLAHPNVYTTEEARAEAIRRRDEMRALAGKDRASKPDSSLFEEVPDHPRYGALAGLPVRKEIYRQFIDSVHMMNNMASSTFGGKLMSVLGKTAELWKLAKVPLNVPVSFARAAIGGAIQLHAFGRMELTSVPGELARAVKDMARNTPNFERAKKWGVVNTTYTQGELAELERMLTAKQIFKYDPDHLFAPVLGMAESLIHIGAKGAKTVADYYGLIDQIHKTALMNYHIDRGMSEEEAALLAHDAVFDYSEVGPMLNFVRRLPIAGSPYMTFTAKAASQTIKLLGEAFTDPSAFLRVLPYLIAPYIASAIASSASGLDGDDPRKIKKLLPGMLRDNPNVVPWPQIDEKGGVSFYDMSYFFPWQALLQLGIITSQVDERGVPGTAKELARSLMLGSGPFADIFAGLKTGFDPFTGRPIVNEFAPPSEQYMQMAAYFWSYFMPPFLAYKPEGAPQGQRGLIQKIVEAHQGKVNPYTHSQYLLPEQAWAGLLGVNVQRMEPHKQRAVELRRRQNELNAILTDARKKVANPNLSKAQRDDLINEYKQFYQQKQERLRKYAVDTNFSPKVNDVLRRQ